MGTKVSRKISTLSPSLGNQNLQRSTVLDSPDYKALYLQKISRLVCRNKWIRNSSQKNHITKHDTRVHKGWVFNSRSVG